MQCCRPFLVQGCRSLVPHQFGSATGLRRTLKRIDTCAGGFVGVSSRGCSSLSGCRGLPWTRSVVRGSNGVLAGRSVHTKNRMTASGHVAPPQPPSEAFQLLAEQLRCVAPAERADALLAVHAHQDLRPAEKQKLFANTVQGLSLDFDWPVLAGFVGTRSAVFAACHWCPGLLQQWLLVAGDRLVVAETVLGTQVMAALTLFCFLPDPPAQFVGQLVHAGDKLATALESDQPSVEHTQSLIRFLVAFSRAQGNLHPDPAVLPLLRVVTARVAAGLPITDMRTANEVEKVKHFLNAMRDMGLQHSDCLAALADWMHKVLLGRTPLGFASLSQVASCLHSVSSLRHAAPDLMRSAAEALDRDGDRCAREESIRPYILFCWAFVYNRMAPPAAATLKLCQLLERDMNLPVGRRQTQPRVAFELLQVLPHLPSPILGLRELLRAALGHVLREWRELQASIAERWPRLKVDVLTPTGHIVAAGLLDETRREFVEWPAGCDVATLRARDVALLHAQPIALLAFQHYRRFSDPAGKVDGALAMHIEALRRSGWKVVLLREVELEKLRARAAKSDGTFFVADVCLHYMSKDVLFKPLRRRRRGRDKWASEDGDDGVAEDG